MVSDIRSDQALATVDVDKNNKPNNSTHDLKKLEEKHPIPNFLDDDAIETLEMQDSLGLEYQKILDAKPIVDELEVSKNISSTVAYKNLDSFLDFAKNNRSFVDAILAILFSENSIGNIFFDNDSREIIIEKNYLLKARSIKIFDNNKTNYFLNALDVDSFVRLGAGKKRILCNLLLSGLDKKEVYTLGWFIKARFENSNLEAFMKNCSSVSKVAIIADSPKMIEERSRQLKNIRVFY